MEDADTLASAASCATDDVHLSESSESESDSEGSLSEHFVENEDGDVELVLFNKGKVSFYKCE